MQKYNASNWGSDTLQACRDIVKAQTEGADIVIHEGTFDTRHDGHLSTISRACVGADVELVVKGASDPEIVYPHITFIEG